MNMLIYDHILVVFFSFKKKKKKKKNESFDTSTNGNRRNSVNDIKKELSTNKVLGKK